MVEYIFDLVGLSGSNVEYLLEFVEVLCWIGVEDEYVFEFEG